VEIDSVVLDLRDSSGTYSQLELTGAYGLVACPFNLVSVSKLLDDKHWLSLCGKTGEHVLWRPNSSIRIHINQKDWWLVFKPYFKLQHAVVLSLGEQIMLMVSSSFRSYWRAPLVEKKSTGNLTFSGNDFMI
jgi:hypothetical protein